MSSIEKSSRAAKQSELNELQAEYSRKKNEIIRKNEASIEDIQENFEDKKDKIIEHHQAAVNHIRKRSTSAIEHANKEQKNQNNSYEKRLKESHKQYEEKISSSKEDFSRKISDAKESSNEKIKKVEHYTQSRTEEIRNRNNDEIKDLKEKYDRNYKLTSKHGDERVQYQKQINESTLKGEVERGQLLSDRLRANNEKEYKDLYLHGESKIKEEIESQSKKLTRLEESSTKNYENQRKKWATKEHQLIEEQSQKTQAAKEAYDDELQRQGKQFKSLYQNNESANRVALNIQKDRLNKELNEIKKDFLGEISRFENKEEDPFYRLENRGSELRENTDFYILKAFVPEHEKDTIKVIIQPDKVTVSGQRSFKDKIEDNGKLMSSSSYQTFKEDFPFEKPVITKGMTRERHGDWVIYTIPKGLETRLNKKA